MRTRDPRRGGTQAVGGGRTLPLRGGSEEAGKGVKRKRGPGGKECHLGRGGRDGDGEVKRAGGGAVKGLLFLESLGVRARRGRAQQPPVRGDIMGGEAWSWRLEWG